MSSLLSALAFFAMADPEGQAVLEKVDRLRHPWPAFSVDVTLKDAKTEQRWRVRTRENGDARVEGLSEKEVGRSVLLLGDDMWLLLPGSKRPVKVSPQQRLLGSAAGGDVARSRLAVDYEVKARQAVELEGKPCLCLDLGARRPALSYQTAKLWVSSGTSHPLRAEYFLRSGKKARTVTFDPPLSSRGTPVLPGMRMWDVKGGEVHLSFSNWIPGGSPASIFVLPKNDSLARERVAQ